jgi:hypothetical protein
MDHLRRAIPRRRFLNPSDTKSGHNTTVATAFRRALADDKKRKKKCKSTDIQLNTKSTMTVAYGNW